MVPPLYFNEPGRGEPRQPPTQESIRYNAEVRENTLRFATIERHLDRYPELRGPLPGTRSCAGRCPQCDGGAAQ